MPILTTALLDLIVTVVIGVIVGVTLHRYGKSWLGRRLSAAASGGDLTAALVGIAGAFMGFHVGVVLGLLPIPLMLFVAATVGAIVTVLIWRRR